MPNLNPHTEISFDLKDLKNELIGLLHEHGIPEFKITLKEYKNNPKGNLGCYRSMSQFRSNPIICLDIEAHKNTLIEIGEYDEYRLKNAVMDTLGHEYGHVIEEWIRWNAETSGNKDMLNKLKAFENMEDFAEEFGRWINGTGYMSTYQLDAVMEIVDFYVKKLFEEESINWVRQPKWKRTLDYYLDTNEKSYASYASVEGSFNRCKQVSEAMAPRLANICDVDVKILRASGYKSSLENAHPKWKKIPHEHVVHYVVLLDNNFVVDLTSKQFNPDNPARLLLEKKDFDNLWQEVEVYQDYTQKKNKGFKLK